MVTVESVHHGCIVALYGEAQGSSVACADVAVASVNGTAAIVPAGIDRRMDASGL